MKKYKVLDLYAGCGGLSLGFRNSGYSIVSAVEIDKWASETFEKNFSETNLFKGSVKEYLKKENIKKYDVIVGGPPCQGFSIAASNRRKENDQRNQEYRIFLDAVKKFSPKLVLFENVPEIIKFKNYKGDLIVDEINNILTKSGYFISYKVLNVADYGVPQLRKRFILIASKKKKFTFPNPTHGKESGLFNNRYLSIWDAISDLPSVKPKQYKEDAILKYDKDPKNNFQSYMRKKSNKIYNHISMRHTDETIERFIKIRSNNGFKKTYDQNHRVLNKDKPSPTITASFYSSFIHPTQNRNITARESARIQTFPDNFIFYGKKTTLSKSLLRRKGIFSELFLDQFNQVGNAVPVMLAQVLSKELKKYL